MINYYVFDVCFHFWSWVEEMKKFAEEFVWFGIACDNDSWNLLDFKVCFGIYCICFVIEVWYYVAGQFLFLRSSRRYAPMHFLQYSTPRKEIRRNLVELKSLPPKNLRPNDVRVKMLSALVNPAVINIIQITSKMLYIHSHIFLY